MESFFALYACKQLSNVVVPAEKHEKRTKRICMPVRSIIKPSDERTLLSSQLDGFQEKLLSWPPSIATDKAKKKAIEQYGT